MQSIYQEIVGQLKGTNEKLWQSVCLRLCRMYLEKQMYKELDTVPSSTNYYSWLKK